LENPNDAMTVKQLRDSLAGVPDHRIIVLRIKEDPADKPLYHDDDDHDLRGVIRSIGVSFKGAQQIDREDRDVCILTITTSDF
jgi:hypothetical protein